MSLINRIEAALELGFARSEGRSAPPRLMAAMRQAVFPGGARIRPQLCLAVANACGANPFPLVVPCHRVVAKNGLGGFMQGFEGGLEIKQWLLAHETN